MQSQIILFQPEVINDLFLNQHKYVQDTALFAGNDHFGEKVIQGIITSSSQQPG